MKPKQSKIKQAEQDGSLDRVVQLLSLTIVLNTISNGLADEAADLMRSRGLLLGPIKQKHNAMMHAADAFFYEVQLMALKQRKMDMFADIDHLRSAILKWARLDQPFQPKMPNEASGNKEQES